MSINQQTQNWAQDQQLPHQFFKETTSTNDIAKQQFPKADRDFFLYLADHQTQGRGRGSNQWQNSSPGDLLLSTWCFKTEKSPQPILTPLLGMGLIRALKSFDQNIKLRLKAPNDIYFNNAKLSGLLVEVVQQGDQSMVAVGLGLNVFSKPQIDIATACLSDTGVAIKDHWSKFCNQLLQQWKKALKQSQSGELTPEQCEELLSYLNEGLSSEQSFNSVSAQGDLHNSAGQISWMDL